MNVQNVLNIILKIYSIILKVTGRESQIITQETCHNSIGNCSQRFLLVLIESSIKVGKGIFSSFVTGYLSGMYNECQIKTSPFWNHCCVLLELLCCVCCVIFLFDPKWKKCCNLRMTGQDECCCYLSSSSWRLTCDRFGVIHQSGIKLKSHNTCWLFWNTLPVYHHEYTLLWAAWQG